MENIVILPVTKQRPVEFPNQNQYSYEFIYDNVMLLFDLIAYQATSMTQSYKAHTAMDTNTYTRNIKHIQQWIRTPIHVISSTYSNGYEHLYK